MIRFFLIVSSLFFSTLTFCQNTLSSTDDLGRISLTPVIVNNSNCPSYAEAVIKDKLAQIVTQNGLGGTSYEHRFVITANVIETYREMTSTAPAMVVINLQPSLYIGDIESGNLFASCHLGTKSGVGTNETKAYLNAIKNIQTESPELTHFLETGKEKIIQYYNSQIDFIISKAQSLLDQELYDEAICLLFSVPDVCKDAYLQAMDMTAIVYQQKINKESAVLLNTAYQLWNANQSYEGAEKAASFLSKIHPLSDSVPEALSLSEAIARRVKEIDTREWNFKMQQYADQQNRINKQIDNSHEEKMQLINAARDVGVAKAAQPVTYNYNRITWW